MRSIILLSSICLLSFALLADAGHHHSGRGTKGKKDTAPSKSSAVMNGFSAFGKGASEFASDFVDIMSGFADAPRDTADFVNFFVDVKDIEEMVEQNKIVRNVEMFNNVDVLSRRCHRLNLDKKARARALEHAVFAVPSDLDLVKKLYDGKLPAGYLDGLIVFAVDHNVCTNVLKVLLERRPKLKDGKALEFAVLKQNMEYFLELFPRTSMHYRYIPFFIAVRMKQEEMVKRFLITDVENRFTNMIKKNIRDAGLLAWFNDQHDAVKTEAFVETVDSQGAMTSTSIRHYND